MQKIIAAGCIDPRYGVPVVDCGAGDFSQRLGMGIVRHGFILMMGHGISMGKVGAAYAALRELMTQPPERLRAYERLPGRQYGYTPQGGEKAVGAKAANQMHYWHLWQDQERDVLPDDLVPGFREAMYALHEELQCFSLFADEALAQFHGLPRDFYTKRRAETTLLRTIHYPRQEGKRKPRSNRHFDLNWMTDMLVARGGGLEVKSRRSGWRKVSVPPDGILRNSADMAQILTRDLARKGLIDPRRTFPSVMHGVTATEDEVRNDRYSLPFFGSLRRDVTLCRGLTAGRHTDRRIAAINKPV
jgi:isopenicillin N synthase-like dioxygenase